MTEKNYVMRRYVYSADGVYRADGDEKSLEGSFGHVRLVSLSGINAIGKQKGVYTESYPESDSLRVYVSPSVCCESTSVTLSLCVFGAAPDMQSSLTVAEQIAELERSWYSLYDFLAGALILWSDDCRGYKALLYVSEECVPSSDIVRGIPYLRCDVKFKNVFGRTFPVDDTTIEGWLSTGGGAAV